MTAKWESVPNEDLRAGNVINLWCGEKTITRIAPYTGPHKFLFAIAEYAPGPTRGISLETGGHTDRLKVTE